MPTLLIQTPGVPAVGLRQDLRDAAPRIVASDIVRNPPIPSNLPLARRHKTGTLLAAAAAASEALRAMELGRSVAVGLRFTRPFPRARERAVELAALMRAEARAGT